jgi:hypothetical protein
MPESFQRWKFGKSMARPDKNASKWGKSLSKDKKYET